MLRGGWINQSNEPCTQQLDDFVSAKSLTGSGFVPLLGGVGPAAGVTWGREFDVAPNATATEIGIGAGLGRYYGVTQSYNFRLR